MMRKHVVGAAISPSGDGSASRVTAKTHPPVVVRSKPCATREATGTGKAHDDTTWPDPPKTAVDNFAQLIDYHTPGISPDDAGEATELNPEQEGESLPAATIRCFGSSCAMHIFASALVAFVHGSSSK